MNILFFDFDGVLSSWQDWNIYSDNELYNPASMISNNKIKYINRFLKNRNLEAVFFPISSWSDIFKNKKDLSFWLKEMNLTNLKVFNGVGLHYYDGINRGKFIKEILENNKVKNYIIFDDEELNNEYKDLNIIKTDMYDGIQYKHIQIFEKQIKSWE